MFRSLPIILAPLAAGCLGPRHGDSPAAVAPVATPVSPPVASSGAPADPILGRVNDTDIKRSQISAQAKQAIRDLENEQAQRKLHLLWVAIEEQIDDQLMAAEAKRRGISPADLRSEEIDRHLTTPSEEDLRAAYEMNRDVLGVPYDVAAPLIKSRLEEKRREILERALIQGLREKAKISYTLPIPELPRQQANDERAPAKGPRGARVSVVEFSDFECPFCSQARLLLMQLLALYPNDVRVLYRDFPLSQHPHARAAAEAAQCAHEQEKFWPYHDLLFESQDRLAAEDLSAYAQEVGLDMEEFAACLTSDRPSRAVKRHEEAAQRLGVDGTPAIFINGVKLIGILPMPLLQALIERELARE